MKAARTRAYNLKHAGTKKHAAGRKHTPTAAKSSATAHAQKAKVVHLSPKVAKARAWSLGDVSCCAAQAVGRSLRLAGWLVTAGDVLALYKATADSADEGASIAATLEAAYRWGLAGVRPLGFGPAESGWDVFGQRGEAGEACHDPRCRTALDEHPACCDAPRPVVHAASVVLGLDLPEAPHAVTLDPGGGVWSWGALYGLWPDAVVEEAWQVMWP